MTSSILLAYATRYGSTQEVAQSMTNALRDSGYTVDLQPAKQVHDLSAYNAIILGAPLYMFHWHNEAKRFLARHQKALVQLPVAIFALGPFHNKEEEMNGAREQLDKELLQYPWLRPTAVQVFPGKFDAALLRFPYSLIPALKNMPPSDDRDWPAIQTWAVETAKGLQISI